MKESFDLEPTQLHATRTRRALQSSPPPFFFLLFLFPSSLFAETSFLSLVSGLSRIENSRPRRDAYTRLSGILLFVRQPRVDVSEVDKRVHATHVWRSKSVGGGGASRSVFWSKRAAGFGTLAARSI